MTQERTVVLMLPSPGGDGFMLAEPHHRPPSVGRSVDALGASPGEVPFAALRDIPLPARAVETAGAALFDALTANDAVAWGLGELLQRQAAEGPRSLYLLFAQGLDGADALPWEALYDARGRRFPALEAGWSLGRMLDGSTLGRPDSYRLDPPLRILAVVAAAGIPNGDEWQALLRAFDHPDVDLPAACHLQLLVADPSLKQQIDGHVPRGSLTIECDFLSWDRLESRMESFRPHILHFFCHGDEVSGRSRLELDTRSSFVRPESGPGLVLELEAFRTLYSRHPGTWLVNLNCCLGAAPPSGSTSLAADLVTEGFPAVVGMREVVANVDANRFTTAFYRSALRLVRRALEPAIGGNGESPSKELEWASAVNDARHRLASEKGSLADAGSRKEWTLPVIYVQPKPFVFEGRSAPTTPERARLEAALATLETKRAEILDLGLEDAMLAEVLRPIDDEIAELRRRLAD